MAAIDFLNPAPLMWDFEHAPLRADLQQRYNLKYTMPSRCADDLLAGRAGLGLIPIAALTPELAVVPGCTIASLDYVRSIQLIVKLRRQGAVKGAPITGTEAIEALPLSGEPGESEETDEILRGVRTIAADTASRSSLAYTQILFRRFIGSSPEFVPAAADPVAMLTLADAALLIGDPALLALERRAAIEAAPGVGPCLWIDIAHQWRTRTGLPWVAAVWATRPEALAAAGLSTAQLVHDLQTSRDHGLAHIDDLVLERVQRIELPTAIIGHYLTRNLHYTLDADCIEAISLFRRYAAESNILPPIPPGLKLL